ncbi:hypothetical protein [Flavobacterium seoulense]|uniref:Fibronectin type-III domain-containing protein n=1 Tax=Flavobacterium seoulense TaxID=1492738 RepID=A0A066WP87_9FLAO|nr:hypothetical protein [Flavobacterium seoulense]KDN55837.1 hypothetical protein FEM21_10280 [Flavobacterium seoulense]
MRKPLIYIVLLLVIFSTACSKDDNENTAPELGELHLSIPLDNSTCEGKSISSTKCEVVLSWEPTSDQESYTLKVTNLQTSKVVLIQNDIKTTSYKLTLDKNVPFSWEVSSFNGALEKKNSSSVWKFYASAGVSVTNYAPFPADLIAPIQDKIVTAVDGKITLKWAGSDTDSSVLKYTVYLDKVDGKQTPAATLTNLSDTQISVAVASGTYYWRVKTSDGNSSSFSQIVKFTVN